MQNDQMLHNKSIIPKGFSDFILKDKNLNIITLFYFLAFIILNIQIIIFGFQKNYLDLLFVILILLGFGILCLREGLNDIALETCWMGRGIHRPNLMRRYTGIDAIVIGIILVIISIISLGFALLLPIIFK